jgi:GNAT superfamily N-acetyltransferase
MIPVSLATQADLESIIELFHQIDQHYYGAGAPERDAIARHVRQHILREPCGIQVALALEAGRPVGLSTFSVLYPAPDLTGQLFMKELFVVPGRRGAGVGRALLGFLARFALANGCSRFDWTAEITNPEAVRFYDRLGVPRVPEKIYYRLSDESLGAMAATKPWPGTVPLRDSGQDSPG